jgi:hypothetical protein
VGLALDADGIQERNYFFVGLVQLFRKLIYPYFGHSG